MNVRWSQCVGNGKNITRQSRGGEFPLGVIYFGHGERLSGDEAALHHDLF
jgi:hypothetical protein